LCRILRDHHQFAHAMMEIARDRYNKTIAAEQLIAPG
jgi:hypothetical protein